MLILFIGFSGNLQAQKITITGKLADAKTQEPLVGALVHLLKNKQIGTITDADGNFSLSFDYQKDTLVFEYVGYKTKKVAFTQQAKQVFSLLLEEDSNEIEAITITPGENPAWAIMRKVVKNKSKNDKRSLQAYECDTYNRIEGYVNEGEKGLSNLRVMKDMAKAAEKIPALRDSKGKTLIPILVSESFSRFFYLGKPEKEREDVKATNLTGLGLESAEGFGQILTGGKLNEYNFYRNQ
ncbi:MAG: carboxypeptidase-like regulatory domain-containing protein, partial [Raineya sp.]